MPGVITLTDSLVTAPQQPPVTVAYAKAHLRSLSAREDELVASWILGAASSFEEYTGRQIITATRELWIDRFPDYDGLVSGTVTGTRIQLPKPPLQAVVSVTYVDSAGASVAFSDGASPETVSYSVKAPAGPYAARGWIEPLYGLTWPTARIESGAVRIQYRCGYGDTPDDVPAEIRDLLCRLVAGADLYRTPMIEGRLSVQEDPYVRMKLEAFKFSALPTMVPR
jgi:uncharacterized phiE125 gp8 family phage protein